MNVTSVTAGPANGTSDSVWVGRRAPTDEEDQTCYSSMDVTGSEVLQLTGCDSSLDVLLTCPHGYDHLDVDVRN